MVETGCGTQALGALLRVTVPSHMLSMFDKGSDKRLLLVASTPDP
jgi:hypothetical protein